MDFSRRLPSSQGHAASSPCADGMLDELEARHEEILQLREQLAAAEALRADLAAAQARAAHLARAVLSYRGVLARLRLDRLLRLCGWRAPLEDAVAAIRAQRLFDAEWYLARNPDVAASGHDPLLHYLLFGADEGRNPNPGFDSAFYVQTHADVRAQGINPLAHYALHGAGEGRAVRPAADSGAPLAPSPTDRRKSRGLLGRMLRRGRGYADIAPVADGAFVAADPAPPDWSEFETLVRSNRRRLADANTLDVIVPVYRGHADTLVCLLSVLRAPVTTAFEVIVVNDASPEPDLARDLRALADMGLITLIENERNLGYPASVNRGLALHPGRDVVLLNSDTEVFGDWLDRLTAHASGDVATVTPLTDNGTICGYPLPCRANAALADADCATLDAMAARINPGRSLAIPTGVGFCMAVRRDALRRIGPFDAAAFGRGYGEENDFCLRAAAAGWRNVMALDVFVRHRGERSFGSAAHPAREAGLQEVRRRYPGFHAQVQAHIAADPAACARARIDAARLLAHGAARDSILCFTHARGGGIERHLSDMAAHCRAEGIALCRVQPSASKPFACDVVAPEGLFLPNLRGLALNRRALLPVLDALSPRSIEVHSLVGWPGHALALIPALASALRVPLSVVLHDYAPLCPMITLIDASGLYCGEAGEEQCRACIAARPQDAAAAHGATPFSPHGIDIASWRRAYARLLRQADRIVAPSEDTARRYRRHFSGLAIDVRPHPEPTAPAVAATPRRRAADGRCRVLTIGAIGPHKGAAVLEACARDAAARRLPIDFLIAGYSDRDERLLAHGNVRITGRYREADILVLVASLDADLAFLPSVWPETHCYTLSVALAGRLPVAVFDLGAQAERLEDGYPHLKLPLALARTPALLNDRLMDFAQGLRARQGG